MEAQASDEEATGLAGAGEEEEDCCEAAAEEEPAATAELTDELPPGPELFMATSVSTNLCRHLSAACVSAQLCLQTARLLKGRKTVRASARAAPFFAVHVGC